MKTEKIRERLVEWAKRMTSEYMELKIRFEYSVERRVYLVSLYPDNISDMETFSSVVMTFEDEMESLYGCDAPLFCDNEELFQLGPEAETIVGITESVSINEWNLQIDNLFAVNPEYYNFAA